MVTWLKIPFIIPDSCTHQGLSPDITISGRYNQVRRYLRQKVRFICFNISVTAGIHTWLFRLHNPEPWPVRVSSSLVRPQVAQQIILARYGKLKSLPQTHKRYYTTCTIPVHANSYTHTPVQYSRRWGELCTNVFENMFGNWKNKSLSQTCRNFPPED